MLSNEMKVIVKQDAMEGFVAFRKFKNLMFVVLLLSLILQQCAFWVVHTNYGDLEKGEQTAQQVPKGPLDDVADAVQTAITGQAQDKNEVKSTKISTIDILKYSLKYSRIAAIYAAMLYCLALIMGLKILLAGKLPGIKGNAKAFFLSLILIVVIIPWQPMVEPPLTTALFGYDELISSHDGFDKNGPLADAICYFGRFVGLCAFCMVILFAAQGQCRSASKRIIEAVQTVQHKVQQRLASNHLQNRPLASATLKMTPDEEPIPLESVKEEKPNEPEKPEKDI